jgi:hypothetical protein
MLSDVPEGVTACCATILLLELLTATQNMGSASAPADFVAGLMDLTLQQSSNACGLLLMLTANVRDLCP